MVDRVSSEAEKGELKQEALLGPDLTWMAYQDKTKTGISESRIGPHLQSTDSIPESDWTHSEV